MFGAVNPLQHEVFQAIFGEIMTLLIALEFNHTLRYVVTRHQSIIQTKVVVLSRYWLWHAKFIILDIRETTPGYLLGLAAVTLALGALTGSSASAMTAARRPLATLVRRDEGSRGTYSFWRRARERQSRARLSRIDSAHRSMVSASATACRPVALHPCEPQRQAPG